MRNLLRFLGFVAVVACAVGIVYLWKTAAPAPVAVESASTASRTSPRLAELDREFTALVGDVLPSVVSITATPAGANDPRQNVLRGLLGAGPEAPQLGAGAIVSKDGYIVTNWHVIQNAGAAQIQLNDGRSLPAKLVGGDDQADVAVLKIDAEDLRPIAFGDSDDVKIGQMVIAVGNPFGLRETVTKGIVSGKGRRTSEGSKEFLQTDAPINPGNSGGPLVDLNGRIVALNNWILQNSDGMGFAIPSNTVRRVYESIRQYGHVIHPWFGVDMLPLTPAIASELGLPDSRGALVQKLINNSPASRAGLQPGDVILTYNDRPVADWRELRRRVAETEPGQQVALGVFRAGRNLKLRATIEKQPGE